MHLVRILCLICILSFFAHGEEPLRVSAMTFNIRLGVAKDGENSWQFRTNMVCDVIRKRQPDFVGMQEAWKFQTDVVLAALPEYAFIGRSRQEDESKGEWCPVLYRRDRFELVKQETFWLSETPDKPASTTWGNQIPRICTWGLFHDRKTGRQLYLYNTHFDHKSQNSREHSALLCRKVISERMPSAPWIFMGDLNAGEDNKAIANLVSDGPGKMADTFRILRPDAKDTGTFNFWKGRTDGSKIDYVYVSSDKTPKVIKAEIIHDHNDEGRYPSDHYPVWAVLEF